MPIVRIPNIGAVGLNKDLSQHDLPINAFTDSRDVMFLNGSVWQGLGYGQVYDTPSVVPYHLLPVNLANGARYWIYAGLTAIHGVTITAGAAVHTDLSGAAYGATANSWTSTVLGGVPILNNGVDNPLQWDLNTANNFASLTNWPANTKCKALRGFRNFLVALNVTEAGTNYPMMVRTSHPADPGAVPVSWDYTDTTRDTLRFDLATATSPIVDGCALRDALVISTEKELFRLDFTGGQFVSQATKVLGTSGALNRNCMVEVDGFLVILTGSDVIVHDGQSAKSCLDKATRRWLFQNIDVDYAHLCFLMKNPFFNQVYICFPSIGATACDTAMVWNWDQSTVGIKSLPNVYCGASGSIDNGLTGNWDQDSAPWDSDLTAWNGPDFVPSTARCIVGATGPKLFMLDSSAAFDGAIPAAYLERRGLSFDIPENEKLVRGIRPRISGNTGQTVLFKVGSQNDPWSEPEWSESMPFTIGETVELDCLVQGRYIAWRMDSGTAYQVRLDSMDFDVMPAGLY